MIQDIDLAKKVLRSARFHPFKHNQEAWHRCLAGITVRVAGGKATRSAQIEGVAQELLGITGHECDRLFYCMNERRARRRLARMIVEAEAHQERMRHFESHLYQHIAEQAALLEARESISA